ASLRKAPAKIQNGFRDLSWCVPVGQHSFASICLRDSGVASAASERSRKCCGCRNADMGCHAASYEIVRSLAFHENRLSRDKRKSMTRVSHRIKRQTRKITWGRLLTLILSPVTLNAAESFERLAPAYKQLRYDENYQYLRDSSLRTDFMDALKYIPLNQEGESYLTLGGEIR